MAVFDMFNCPATVEMFLYFHFWFIQAKLYKLYVNIKYKTLMHAGPVWPVGALLQNKTDKRHI